MDILYLHPGKYPAERPASKLMLPILIYTDIVVFPHAPCRLLALCIRQSQDALWSALLGLFVILQVKAGIKGRCLLFWFGLVGFEEA